MSALARQLELAKSYAAKLLAYGPSLAVIGQSSDLAEHLTTAVPELLANGEFGLLRAYSKEVDVIIRDTLEPNEQELVVRYMAGQGVHPAHLPKLPSSRRLRSLIRRGLIRSDTDLDLVRSALDAPLLYKLSKEELRVLGALFDTTTAKARGTSAA